MNERMKYAVIMCLIVSTLTMEAQQWNGSNNTTDAINRDGKVGIGTTSPAKNLEVGLTNKGGGIRVSWGSEYWGRVVTDLGYPEIGGFVINAQSGGGWANITMQTDGVPRFRLNHIGHVGIGTTEPSYILDVAGRARIRSGGGTAGLWFNNLGNTAERGFVGMISDDYMGLHGTGGAGWGFSMNVNTGNVGVGTANNTNKLTVVGGGTYNIDLKVNGRIQTGDDNNAGGLWVDKNTTQFIGQYDANKIGIWNKNWRMVVDNAGNVGIGTVNPTSMLTVNGTITAEEISVKDVGADFVFEENYKLRPLHEVEAFIKENKHLPEIAPACETEQGINVGEFNEKLLQKIEELTLYVIELDKKVEALEKENQELRTK